ncbi:MAG: hypothetical protein ACN6OX_12150 [Pseudomonas sp.]
MPDETVGVTIARDLVKYLSTRKYDAVKFAMYAYSIWLDYKLYHSGDVRLVEIMEKLRSMDAGDEFEYSKEEALEMLSAYLRNNTSS